MQKQRLITLTSDFGLADHYVATMKAVLLRGCPGAQLIDITHQSPRHDILAGSFVLERALAAFPPGTMHLAVVDPGVGSQRRLLVVKIGGQFVVCPDNGLITWAWRRHDGGKAREITWRPSQASATFHGRDILAPIAGRLAAGTSVAGLTKAIGDPVLLDVAPARAGSSEGQVIYIDRFGNATTNILDEGWKDSVVIVAGKKIGQIQHTYSDVARGKALALIGSSGLLEIAVREGSAEKALGLRVGSAVRLIGT